MFNSEENIENEEEVVKQAMRLTNAIVLPMVLRSAINLNIIDIIMSSNNGFVSSTEIADKLPASHPNTPLMLDQMLCVLASYDILKCSLVTRDAGKVERVYGAGSVCKFLVSDKYTDGTTLSPLFLVFTQGVLLKTWDGLDETLIAGGKAFDNVHGTNIFNYLKIDERFNKLFHEGMSCHATLIMKKVLDVYKGFEQVKILVDVGGGIGSSLHTITSKYPHLRGINYDLPHVVVDAPSYPGVDHVGGDFFETIPKGDAIFLKWIIHDWNDEDCLKILKNCWEVLENNGKVIIVEMVLPEKPENDISSQIGFEYNMLMLVQSPSGKERTLKEFEALAFNSGFKDCKLICSQLNSWVIEFHK